MHRVETPAAVEADTVGADAQKEPRNVESETPMAPKSEPSSGTVAETENAHRLAHLRHQSVARKLRLNRLLTTHPIGFRMRQG